VDWPDQGSLRNQHEHQVRIVSASFVCNFDRILNVYLVLGNSTVLKSMVFLEMVKFLEDCNQLHAVMI